MFLPFRWVFDFEWILTIEANWEAIEFFSKIWTDYITVLTEEYYIKLFNSNVTNIYLISYMYVQRFKYGYCEINETNIFYILI